MILRRIAKSIRSRDWFTRTRILHQRATAPAQWHALAAFRSVGVLDVLSNTPPRALVAKARQDAPLNRFATHDGATSALSIEFAIVVAGVFIGIQVANWNEARKFAAQEQSYLGQLREEIQNNHSVVELRMPYTTEVIEAGQRAVNYLDGNGECGRASDCAELLVDFFHASQVWGSSYQLAKYLELERLGFPSDPRVREPVREFYLFLQDWSFVNQFTPSYREAVRGHFSPEASRQLWGNCHATVSGQLEELSRDCVADLGLLDTSAMLRSIHSDPVLKQQLQFWLGQNILAETGYPDMLALGEAAMAALERELASTR